MSNISLLSSLLDSPASSSAELDCVIGQNPVIRKIARDVERAAEAECTVLISGETGTGKEIWAKLLHKVGQRVSRPFIPVNCAALTVSLAESQLFGHEKGAFTGAAGRSLGVFRAAEGGVVFLDEVGEMPMELQPKLLRVLQQREVTPVGSSNPIEVNVQIIAATNRDLEAEVAKGNFREDLYYRLNMVELRIPPLRQRVEDIPEFIKFFSRKFATQYVRQLWAPMRPQCGSSVSLIGRAMCGNWPTSSSNPMCWIVPRACPIGMPRPHAAWLCRSWICKSCDPLPCGRLCKSPAATRARRPNCWACMPTR